MVTVHMKISGELLSKGPATVQRRVDRFVTLASDYLVRQVQKRTPQGVGGQGGLIASIDANVTGQGTHLVRGRVFHGKGVYGDVVERGRRPGKMPPPGALMDWVKFKFGDDPREATRIEYLIRRKIAQKGFEGKAMFFNALWENHAALIRMAKREGLELAVELTNA